MMAGDQHALHYVSRILLGTVGTALIKPPLPKKYAGPLKGGLAFSFSGTGNIFENASKFISRPAEPAGITEPRRGEGKPASGKGNPALATNHRVRQCSKIISRPFTTGSS